MTVWLMLFWLHSGTQSNTHWEETALNFEYWSFLGLAMCGKITLMVLTKGIELQLPISQEITELNNWYSSSFSSSSISN